MTTWTKVQSASADAPSGSLAFPSDVTDGNLIVVVLGSDATGMTVTSPQGTLAQVEEQADSASDQVTAMWYAVAGGSGPVTIVPGYNGGSWTTLVIQEWAADNGGAIALDQHDSAATASTANPATPAVVPTADGALLVASAYNRGASLSSGDEVESPFAYQDNSDDGGGDEVGVASYQQTAAASVSATFNFGGADICSTIIASFVAPAWPHVQSAGGPGGSGAMQQAFGKTGAVGTDTVDGGAVAGALAGDLLVSVAGTDNAAGTTLAAGTGWTLRGSGSGGGDTVAIESKEAASTGSVSATWSPGTAAFGGAVVTAAFRATTAAALPKSGAKVGTLTSPASAGSQSYTVPGLGTETPKALVFFFTRQGAEGYAAGMATAVGFAAGPSSQACVSTSSSDNVSPTVAYRNQRDSHCLSVVDPSTGGTDVSATLTSFDPGGFTLDFPSAGHQYLIHYVAFYGDDLQAHVGVAQAKTSTGTQAYTGVGFEPDCLLTGHISTSSDPSSSFILGGGRLGIGAAAAGGAGALYVGEDTGIATSDVVSYQKADRVFVQGNPSEAPSIEARLSSFDADGFTLDYVTQTSGSSIYFFYLALAGGGFDVLTDTQKTSTGTKATAGAGFPPNAALLMGTNRATSASEDRTLMKLSLGAADGTGEAATWTSGTDGANPADENMATLTTAALRHATNPSTTDAEATLSSFDSDGFTLSWGTADATAREFFALVVGPQLPTAAEVFTEAGVIMFDLTGNAAAMDDILDYAADNHFGWVCLQCFDGTTLIEQTQIPLWKAGIQSRGMRFGLWGVQHTDPSGDAGRADSQIDLWGAEFYIANAEAEYKTDTGGTRANAGTFCTAFRAAQPNIAAALVTYAATGNEVSVLGDTTVAAAGVMDFKAWYDAGFHYLPEAYASDPLWAPDRVLRHARRAKWPMSRIHLVLGIYAGGSTYDGADYRGFLARLENTEWEASVVADAPKAFYTMQDGSGPPADMSGNGLAMTSVTGSPDYVQPGPFTGVSGIRTIGGETLVRSTHVSTVTNNLTMELLIQMQALGASDQTVLYNGNSGANGWGIIIDTNYTWQYLCGGVALGANSAVALTQNKWQYLVVTRDAGTWKYYLDGALVNGSAGTTAPATPSGTVLMGGVSIQFASAMVAIHETALSATQVAARYAKLPTLPVASPSTAYGFSLFLGDLTGTLAAATHQDYIDLGLAVQDQAAAGLVPQQLVPSGDTTTTGWAATPLWSKIEEITADGTTITATAG